VNLNANQSAFGLIFDTVWNMSIQSGSGTNTLTLGSNGITVTGFTQFAGIGCNLALNAAQTWSNSTLSLSVSGAVTGNTVTYQGVSDGSPPQLEFDGSTDNTGFGLIVSAGDVILNKNSGPSVHAVGSGGLVISQMGTVFLEGSGGDQIADDTPVTVNGVLDMAGTSETIGGLSGTGAVINGSHATTTSTLTLNCTSNFSFAGGLGDGSAPLALTKSGTGVQTLSGGVGYSGATNVTQGTLEGGATNAISPNSAYTISFGATLNLGGFSQRIASLAGAGSVTTIGSSGADVLTVGGDNSSTTFSGVISNASGGKTLALIKNGTGTLTLSGANTFTGGLTINNGEILLGSSGALSGGCPVSVSASGTLSLNSNSATVFTLIGSGVVRNSGNLPATLTVASSIIGSNFSGQLVDGSGGGALSLVKTGSSSTLTLSGANSYSGATTVSQGTVLGGATNAFSPNSAYTVSNGATLNLGGFTQIIGSLAGAGSVTTSGLSGGDTLLMANNNNTTFSGIISDATGGRTLTLSKVGTGVLTLSGNNSFSGGVVCGAGTLAVGNDAALGTGTIQFGGFGPGSAIIQATGTAHTLASPISLAQNFTCFVGGSLNLTLTGPITGPSTAVFSQSGTETLTVSGPGTYFGPTNVVSGTLQAGAANSFSPNSAYNVSNGAALNLGGFSQAIGSLSGAGSVTTTGSSGTDTLTVGNDNSNSAFSGAITDASGGRKLALTKAGTGTLTLSGNNSFSGTVTVNSGTFAFALGTLSANVVNNATFSYLHGLFWRCL
jgi:autotransporter-associated beta strand protein